MAIAKTGPKLSSVSSTGMPAMWAKGSSMAGVALRGP
jgi:hypothetical protein